MRRTLVGGRTAGVAAAVLLLTLAAQAQTARSGPTTTPSGSYLNLQPRRQKAQPPLVAPPSRRAAAAVAARDAGRQVVCGLTVITPPSGLDDAMVKPVAKDGPRPAMRAVDPPICGPTR